MTNRSDHTNRRRLLLIELNEFEPSLLREASARFNLRNVRALLELAHGETTTADEIEHHGLDPWVQWVNVHCGQPSSVHGIRRLGETRRQKLPQLWNELGREGLRWGVWGAMNAPLGDPRGCAFFVPDPWSFEERAYPERLNHLLALPCYVAKNYLEPNYWDVFTSALRLAWYFAPPQHWPVLAAFAPQASGAILNNGPNVHTFTTLLDYLSALCFVRARGHDAPDFSLIFLNHIAHLQHQFWLSGKVHTEMELGLRLNDAMLGLLFRDRRPGEGLIVMNALKQRHVAGQGFYVYRQRSPQNAALALGIEGAIVHQSMTNDGHFVFARVDEAEDAQRLMEACVLSDGHRVFYAERTSPTEIFYQIDFEHRVANGTMIEIGNRRLRFEDVFELVCERTGAHVPNGDVYFDGVEVSPQLANHELRDVVLRHFGIESARGVAVAGDDQWQHSPDSASVSHNTSR